MKPNILFLCIDSLRSDRCFGKNKSSYTPNLDSLINSGIYFSQAITSTDYTIPAMESIFTSIFPFNASYSEDVYNKQTNEYPNIVNDLKNFGYLINATIPKSFSNLGFMDLFENKFEYEHDGSTYSHLFSGLGEKIVNTLECHNSTLPWFHYIHLIDLHKGSKPFKEFDNEKFGNDDYDRTVSSIDMWIGRIIEKIDLKKTIIIVTSDHGEYIKNIRHHGKNVDVEFQSMAKLGRIVGNAMPLTIYPIISKLFQYIRKGLTILKLIKVGKHSLSEYEKRSIFFSRSYPDKYMYDDIIRVPLIFTGFGIDKHKIFSQQVRSVDIFPTVLDLIGKSTTNNILNGKSLTSLLKDQKYNEEYAYLESATFPISKKFQDSVNPVVGLRTSKYKYFKKIKQPEKIFLFDLESDPLEEKNIAMSNLEIVENMENELEALRKENTKNENEDKMNSDEIKIVEDELKKLGYI